MNRTAFAIGNGTSRKNFDLLRLKSYGTSFGCNILFTEFDNYEFPDYLVSIEEYRKEIIDESDFPKERIIYPPLEEQIETAAYHGHSGPRPRSCCGVNLIVETQRKGFRTVFFLGYDFIINDDNAAQSNQFEGSLKFRTNINDTRRRIPYFKWMIRQYPYTNFIFVFPKNTQLQKIDEPNLSYMTYEKMVQKLSSINL